MRAVAIAPVFSLGLLFVAPGRPSSAVRSVPATAAVPETLSVTDRLRVVEQIVEHTRAHFAHWAALGPPAVAARTFDSLATAFRAAARDAADRRAFDHAALAFTAGLRNSHTQFDDRWLREQDGQTLWLTLRPTTDGWVVATSEIEGLRAGDLVTAIDGEPFERFYESRRHLIAASSETTRRLALSLSDHLFPRRFVLTTADGRSHVIVRGEPADSVVRARRRGPPLVSHRWLVADSVAYLRVRRFAPRAYEDSAVATMRRALMQAPAVIVDVRGNSGGSTPRRLLHTLRGDSATPRLPIERSTIGSDRLAVLARLRPIRGPRYRGVLIILIDRGCASACEDFVAPLAASRRALVVGDTTWGSTGQPQSIDLGDGMSFRVSARRYTQVDGSPFEGVGVAPHIAVAVPAASLQSGADPVLERAMREARRALDRRAGG
ncbi:MAG: S41 family peptidase [Gemmatimonadaceae bacterium]|jgi:carboxyl-terminal processing protease|nr:S41 family peptidase [Gemmatimonadaceae bacterium]